MNYELLIEVFLICSELIHATYAAFPPCTDKATTVAGKLNKGCFDTENTYFKAIVLHSRIHTDNDTV